jgi:hypothetical protein
LACVSSKDASPMTYLFRYLFVFTDDFKLSGG